LKKEAKRSPLQVNDGDYFVELQTENPRFIIVQLNSANPDRGGQKQIIHEIPVISIKLV